MIRSTNHSNTECSFRTIKYKRLVSLHLNKSIHFRKGKTFSTQPLIHVEDLVIFCTKSGFIIEVTGKDMRLSFHNML